MNVMSIDLKDWYHCLEPNPARWGDYHDRVVPTVNQLLQPEPVFARLRMLCRGTLLASFPWKYAIRALPRMLWFGVRGCPVRFFTRPEILSLCQRAGFRCGSLMRKGPIYLLVAEPESGAHGSRQWIG